MTLSLHSIFEDGQPALEYLSAAADNDTYEGTGVDMLGYQGVVFFAAILQGNVANFTLKAQQDSASNFGTAADLLGSAVTIATTANADGFGFVEVKNPAERYVRPVIVVADITATSIAIISVRYGKNVLPETNADGELHVGPAEGTA